VCFFTIHTSQKYLPTREQTPTNLKFRKYEIGKHCLQPCYFYLLHFVHNQAGRTRVLEVSRKLNILKKGNTNVSDTSNVRGLTE